MRTWRYRGDSFRDVAHWIGHGQMVEEEKWQDERPASPLGMYALAATRHQPFTVEFRSQASVFCSFLGEASAGRKDSEWLLRAGRN